jgi:hypothetical protein
MLCSLAKDALVLFVFDCQAAAYSQLSITDYQRYRTSINSCKLFHITFHEQLTSARLVFVTAPARSHAQHGQFASKRVPWLAATAGLLLLLLLLCCWHTTCIWCLLLL